MEVIIHRGEIIQCITDYPVCHRCSCDSNTVLFPVFFLPGIRKTVTKLLIHDPGDSICRSHTVKHMCMAVFSLFDNSNVIVITFRAKYNLSCIFRSLLTLPVRRKVRGVRILHRFYQRSVANRADFFCIRKIQIFF